MLEPKAVEISRTPAYPTRVFVAENPGSLEATAAPATEPGHGRAACAVTTLLAVGLTGCGDPEPRVPPLLTQAVVAPLFEHGSGRGSTGCVSTSPPAFLSEEEALQIIREELLGRGIGPLDTEVELEGVTLDRRPPDEYESRRLKQSGATPEQDQEVIPLYADLQDPSRKIAVEFVSREDYWDLGTRVRSASSVTSYDFLDVARRTRERVAEQAQPMYFAVFYDPLPHRTQTIRVMRPPSGPGDPGGYTVVPRDPLTKLPLHEQARELLRGQVRDFLVWLEDRGAI